MAPAGPGDAALERSVSLTEEAVRRVEHLVGNGMGTAVGTKWKDRPPVSFFGEQVKATISFHLLVDGGIRLSTSGRFSCAETLWMLEVLKYELLSDELTDQDGEGA